MGSASGVLGVPAMNSGFTCLVTGDERNVLLACPGPNRFVLVGSFESLDQCSAPSRKSARSRALSAGRSSSSIESGETKRSATMAPQK